MFRTVLHAFHYHDPDVDDDDISRGVPREWLSLLVCDVSTNTPLDVCLMYSYARELGDRRPWVLEPELEHCPHAVPPCLLCLPHTHAPLRLSDAETQTPDAAHITEFKLAFCMLNHARLGAACARVELPSNLVQIIMEIYAPAFAQLFIS
jgi:hypothetical protein